MQPQRLFVAAHLPEAIASILEQRQQTLRQHLGGEQTALCWTPKAQFHLTLAFLGTVEHSAITPIIGSLEAQCQILPVQSLKLGKCGLFSRRGVPTVLWCNVQTSPQMDEWCMRLRQTLQPLCPDLDNKEFHPHLTLGRIKSGRSINRNTLMNLFEQTSLGSSEASWECRQISLVQSQHSCHGAVHSPLHASQLSEESLLVKNTLAPVQ